MNSPLSAALKLNTLATRRFTPMVPPSRSQSGPAPWRTPFLEHISKLSLPTFVLSTLHHPSHPSPSSSPGPSTSHPSPPPATTASPRARTCVLRGLWASLPASGYNPAPRNPEAVYESDMPVFTTDARMGKYPDLAPAPPPSRSTPSSSPFSSSPSPAAPGVEAVFWVAETQTQWRVRGRVWVLGEGGPAGPEGEESRPAREALWAGMRRVSSSSSPPSRDEEWSFAREVTAHFGNLSPAMRGTFRNPAPGTPRTDPPGEGEGLGQKVDDLEDELARRNFRVCVVVPEEVDRVLLTQEPRRWIYRLVGAADGAKGDGGEVEAGWETVELWP